MRTTSTIVAIILFLGAVRAEGAVLCARQRSDGTFNGNVAIREACTSRETALDPAALGLQGPPGPAGAPGPALASLDGVPCDTGTADRPDGRIVVSTDAATGDVRLRCVSTATTPVLTAMLLPGPQVCGGIIPLCVLSRFAVQEVDAGGAPVAGGFACDPGPPNLSPFPVACQTQRFAAGATVRLRAVGGSGRAPAWSGCDAVAGDTCTVTVADGRVVAVQPQ